MRYFIDYIFIGGVVMKVYGHKIEKDWIDTVFQDVTSQANFTAKEVELRLFSIGVRKDICYRAADRVIQKWRKDGKIFYDKGNQCWRDIKHYEAINGKKPTN